MVVLVEEKRRKLEFCVCAGEELSLRDLALRQAQGLILIYDTADRASYEALRIVYNRTLQLRENKPIPHILVAYKSPSKSKVSPEDGVDLATEIHCPLTETDDLVTHCLSSPN